MEIKRGAFLVLTAAIAQVGCTVIQNTNTGGAGGATTTGGTGGSAGTAQGGQSTAGTAGSTASEGGAAGTTSQGGMAGSAGSTASGGSAGSSATGGAGGGSSCDDSVGTPPANCDALQSVTNCTAGGWEETYCETALADLKPKVAEAVSGCILAITDCGTTTVNPYACWRDGLAAACPDSNTETDYICSMAGSSTYCTVTTDSAACHAIVDGLNATGLAAVHTCVESGTTTCYSLWSCIESL
jgi:hypothetical protein